MAAISTFQDLIQIIVRLKPVTDIYILIYMFCYGMFMIKI